MGIFIRSLVGPDREAARQAFSEFISGTTATPNQNEFINLVVYYLTENGVMEPNRLYELPFTDISPQGPEGVSPRPPKLIRWIKCWWGFGSWRPPSYYQVPLTSKFYQPRQNKLFSLLFPA